jgi:hypothetical protein
MLRGNTQSPDLRETIVRTTRRAVPITMESAAAEPRIHVVTTST